MRVSQFAVVVSIAVMAAMAMPARADILISDGVKFDIQLPKGYCALSRSNEKEKPHYDLQERMQQAINRVLVLALPCDDITLARMGKPWKRWVMWLLNGPPGRPTKIPPGMSRSAVVNELAKTLPAIPQDDISKMVNNAASKEGLSLKLRQVTVIDRDETALYSAQTASVNASREIAVVTGWAAIEGHLLTVNSYATYETAKTFQDLLVETKDTLRRTIATTDALLKP